MSRRGQIVTAVGDDRMADCDTGISRDSTIPSSRGCSSRDDQRRKNVSLLELQQQLEEGVVAQPWMLIKLATNENGPGREWLTSK